MRCFLLLCLCQPISAAEELETDAAHELRQVPEPPCPLRGPRFATVTLDVYFAFGHGPSAVGAELARRAVENARAQDVRELLRLAAPGPVSNSPGAQLGAEALVEAEQQGRAFVFVDRVLHEHAGLGVAELVRAGVDAGLDGAKLAAALADRRHAAEVERRIKEAAESGHSAGELMVNGRRSTVWINEEGLGSTIGEARHRAQELLDSGVPLGRLYDKLCPPDEPLRSADSRGKRRLPTDLSGAPVRGPITAPVTIVIFSSLSCGSCGEAAAVLRRLHDAWPGRIREVWRSWVPAYAAANGSGANLDVAGAMLAAAAERQGRFWQLYDLVFAPGLPALPHHSHQELDAAARAAGVDLQNRDPAGERRAVERDQAEARRYGVPFAPAFVVNGILYQGVPQLDRLDRAVRAELSRGLLDRLSAP